MERQLDRNSVSQGTPSASGQWDFWVDRGGTFTDVIGRDPRRAAARAQAAVREPRLWRRRGAGDPRLLASRRGARDPGRARSASSRWAPPSPPTRCSSAAASARCLVTTRGFRDALEIGYQARPKIFARNIVKPEQLYAGVHRSRRARARRRNGRDGARPRRRARRPRRAPRREGFDAVAIVFMHAYRYPEHERQVARARARARLRAGLGQPRMLAADQAGRARRHDRRRRLSLADSVALRRARRRRRSTSRAPARG